MRVKRKERNIARKIAKRAYGTELKRVPIARNQVITAYPTYRPVFLFNISQVHFPKNLAATPLPK